MDALNKMHYYAALTLSAMIGAVLLATTPTLNQQIIILLIFAGFIGVPHGLTDFALLPGLCQRFGCSGSIIKLLLMGALFYLSMIGAFLLFWQWLPKLALMVFLLLSIWHFGEQDVKAQRLRGNQRDLQAALRGLFLIGIIYLAQAETATYFNLLTESEWFIPLPFSETLAVGGASLYILLSAMTKSWKYIIESACIMLMCIVLPPLLSFTLYFCLWHTPRHYIAVMSHKYHSRTNAKIAIFSLLAAVIFFYYSVYTFEIQLSYIVYAMLFFKMLSGLTFAHVVITKIGISNAGRQL